MTTHGSAHPSQRHPSPRTPRPASAATTPAHPSGPPAATSNTSAATAGSPGIAVPTTTPRTIDHAQAVPAPAPQRVGPNASCPTDVWEGPPNLNRYDNFVDDGQGGCRYNNTTIHDTTIATSVALTGGVNLMEANITVASSGTLSMPAGTSLRISNDPALSVAGTLDATGTAASVVSISSTTAAPNNWRGIVFQPGSAGSLDHVHLSYAGDCVGATGNGCYRADIVVDGSSPAIADSTIDFANGNGIEVIDGGNPTLAGDNFASNGAWPVHYDATPATLALVNSGLSASGNGNGDVVGIAGGSFSGTWNVANPGLPLRLDGDITVGAAARLNVGAATTLLFNDAGLYVAGALSMGGTATQPISLTDANGATTPNNWRGIVFQPGSAGSVQHVHLSFAGDCLGATGNGCYRAGVVVDGASPTISGSTIDFANGDGVEVVNGGNPALTADTFLSNNNWAVHYDFTPDINLVNNGLAASGNGHNDALGLAAGTVTGTLTLDHPGLLPVIDGGDLSVAPGATFNVAAGMTVDFSSGLYVGGTLNMTGTATQPITLTDANGVAAPNNWRGIVFQPDSSGALSHVHLSYAGDCLGATGNGCYRAGVVVDGSAPTISDSTIDSVNGNGLQVIHGGNPTLLRDAFNNNNAWPVHYDFTPSIALVGIGLSASGNHNGDVLDIAGGTISGVLTVDDPGLPFRTDGDLSVAAGAQFDVGAGMLMLFSSGLYVAGSLNMTGTATQPISLTDANGATTPNNWRGIVFQPGSAGALSHVHLSFAGDCLGATGNGCYRAGVVVDGSAPTISDSTIDFADGDGVEVIDGGDPTLTADTFLSNNNWAVHYDFTPSVAFVDNGLVASGNGHNDALGLAAGAITGTLTLDHPGLLPVIDGGDLVVGSGATFNVAAGMTVDFSSGLYVAPTGTVTMAGTATAPITLTDSNGVAAPNNWRGVVFQPGSSGALSHVHLSYAGDCLGATGNGCYRAGVVVDGASPTISDSTIDFANGDGVEVVNGGNPTLSRDTFTDNAAWPLRYDFVPSISLVDNGLVASGNGNGDVIDLPGGTITGTLTVADPGLPLRTQGDLGVAAGAAFNVGPGMLLQFNDAGLYVAGSLSLSGTATQPISLTDANGATTPNNWRGIVFQPGSAGSVQHVHLSFAGDCLGATGNGCYRAGVVVDGSAPTISGSTFDNINGNDIEATNGGSPIIHGNTFGAVPGGRFGVTNDSGGYLVDALYNWWGDPSGPGGQGPGTGTPAGPGVYFLPWLTRDPSAQ